MKKATRFTALLLAVLLLGGVCCSATTVEEFQSNKYFDAIGTGSKEYRILSIGDSTSIGYGLCDFGVDSDGETYLGPNGNGMGVYTASSQYAPAYLLSEYVQKTLGDDWSVQPVNLGMEGMRYQEIRSILDPTFTGDGFNLYHLEEYEKLFEANNFGDLKEAFEKEIKAADCIVLDSITNSYGTYLGAKLTGGAFDTNDTIADVAEDLYPGSKETIENTMKKLVESLGITDDSMVKALVDGLSYTYADFMVSFAESIRLIRALNPTCQILVEGPFNVFEGIIAQVTIPASEEGKEDTVIDLDFGGIWASFLSLSENYVTTLCSEKDSYIYVDVPTCETLAGQLANAETTNDIYSHYAASLLKQVAESKDDKIKNITVEQFETDVMPTFKENGGNSILYLYQLAMRNNTIDLMGTLGLVSSANDNVAGILGDVIKLTSYEDVENYYNALPASEQGLLHVYVQLLAGSFAPGAHPSVKGLQQKASALKKAWKNPSSSEQSSETSFIKLIANVMDTVRTSALSIMKLNSVQKLIQAVKVFRLAIGK